VLGVGGVVLVLLLELLVLGVQRLVDKQTVLGRQSTKERIGGAKQDTEGKKQGSAAAVAAAVAARAR
jgi:Na+-transporting methylmalonyl-CoA/oxaloacetate decarboxylase gamma subunit